MSLATNITNLATRIATEIKALRTLVNGNTADLSTLSTTDKSNLVAAINEVKASAGSGGAAINDAATATTSVWSSTKTDAQISAATAALVNGSPAALDTLNELSAALGNDPNFATSLATSLGHRVRFDAAQTKTAGEMLQARTNIGLDQVNNTSDANKPVSTATATALGLKVDKADVGNTETDFVATFNAGLV